MGISRVALVVLASSFCVACAGTQERAAYAPSHAASVATIHTDATYIQRVEAKARARGVDVAWINPPMARTRTATAPR